MNRKPSTSQMRLAWVLKEWRWAVKWTTQDAANAMGLTKATYSRIERGYPMDARSLVSIMEWLFGEEFKSTLR